MMNALDSIREKVLSQWLQGIARDMLAKNTGVSRGTVSRILRRCREEDPDFDTIVILGRTNGRW